MLMAFSIFLSMPTYATWSQQHIKEIIVLEAKQQGFPVEVALAVAETESNFDPYAQSNVGARGVMQIMPKTARDDLGVNPSSLYNPRVNVRAGITFLKHLVKVYDGRYDIALSHYNGGSRVRRPDGSLQIIGATKGYVEKVLHRAKKYKQDNERVKQRYVSTNPSTVSPSTVRTWDSINDKRNELNRSDRKMNMQQESRLSSNWYNSPAREELIDKLQALKQHNLNRNTPETVNSRPLGRQQLANMDYSNRLDLVRQWESF